HGNKAKSSDQPGKRKRSDHPSDLQSRSDELRSAKRVRRAHNRRQPAGEEIEVEQVHEIDDPEQQCSESPTAREQGQDRNPLALLLTHDEIRLGVDRSSSVDAFYPPCDFL